MRQFAHHETSFGHVSAEMDQRVKKTLRSHAAMSTMRDNFPVLPCSGILTDTHTDGVHDMKPHFRRERLVTRVNPGSLGKNTKTGRVDMTCHMDGKRLVHADVHRPVIACAWSMQPRSMYEIDTPRVPIMSAHPGPLVPHCSLNRMVMGKSHGKQGKEIINQLNRQKA